MNLKTLLHALWKLPLCGLLFFFGFIPGAWLATLFGLPAPTLPPGAEAGTLLPYTLLTSLLLALGLAAVACGLAGSFAWRWLVLFLLAWVAYGVNTYLEASIFSTMSGASIYAVVLYLPAALLCSAAVAWLFPSGVPGQAFLAQARSFLLARTAGSWGWRLLAAFLAFPAAYLLFGSLIAPIVTPYYLQGVGQLALPGWDQILPVVAVRSLLFLLVCLPVLMAWNLSNRRLFLSLGLALFILVGGVAMLQAYWLPGVLRVTHGLEIFADETVYAAALVLLGKPANPVRPVSVAVG